MTDSRVAGPAGVELVAGAHGLPMVVIRAPDGARAEAYLHGGQVTSWTPAGAPAGAAGERLFLSAAAQLRPGAPIRGGVPVMFPQFANLGPLPKHGFARTTEWTLDAGELSAETASATLLLADSAATHAIWPHPFALELTVTVGGPTLAVRLDVLNPGDAELAFTAALHTYLRVDHVARVAVRGLEGVRYLDEAAGNVERVQEEREVHIVGEVDRVYLGAPATVEVVEPDRTTVVTKSGFPDTVVWNPGPVRGAALADLEPGGATRMLCVEAAAAGAPVLLAPGARWSGTQTLGAR